MHPDNSSPLYLAKDASDVEMGAVRHRHKKDAEAVFLATSYWRVFRFEISEGCLLFRPPDGLPR